MKRKKTYHMWHGINLSGKTVWISKQKVKGCPIHYYKQLTRSNSSTGWESTTLAERCYDDIWRVGYLDTYIGPISEEDLMLELL